MKKIYTLFLACTLGMGFTGCDDFLDYNPTAVVDEDKAFSEPEAMVNAIPVIMPLISGRH